MKQIQPNLKLVISGFLFIATFVMALSPSAIYGQEKEPTNKDEIWLGGKVIWPGHTLSKATVEVYRDKKFTELYSSGIILSADGAYSLTIEDPGTYYIVAFIDDNDNGQIDAGDGMGIYGIVKWADANQNPGPVQLEVGTKLFDVDIQITAVVDDKARIIPLELSESDIVTGISGKLVWPDHKFPNAILFAYSDPSWNNRIAQASIKETGEYEIALPAGRYYLLAVIDENKTNLLDAGDEFGIWGITRLGMFPKAVEVNKGNITKDRNILITGQMGISGNPLPLQEAAKEKAVILGDRIPISGNVIWPEHDLSFAIVQAYKDPTMTAATAQAKTDDKGRFQLLLPPGEYYVMAGVDADGDGKYTSGDGIGAYAVTNAAEQMPKKLVVTPDSQSEKINLLITAEFDSSGQLKQISGYSMLDAEYSMQNPAVQGTGLSGKIAWEGRKLTEAMLVVSDEDGFASGVRIPLQLGDDGSYTCSTPPGDYYIMVAVDLNQNELVDSGDGRGFYGSGYRGTPQRVTVLEGRLTPFINIDVTESLDSDGKSTPAKTAGSLRFWYGEPGNIYTQGTGDSVTQEWWYWNRGVAFTFEETDAGLNLIDSQEFDPVDPDRPPERITESSAGDGGSKETLYYTFDMIIWATDTDGANQRWVVTGTQPTGASDGSKLLFLDTTGNIYLIEPDTDAPAELVLGRQKSGLQPAVSHSGKAVAFTTISGSYRQIILKNLETKEENAIPIGAMEVYHPAWSSDDEMIAYSASLPTSDNQQNINRDIYYYDLTTGRNRQVSTGPLDEFEPAWSPVSKKTLVYCRAEGDHSQLWIVNFDADGKPVERQLTKYGGHHPAWSPDGGKIVYENNAQLWTINPDGSDEMPIVVDDEPVFGLDPFWAR